MSTAASSTGARRSTAQQRVCPYTPGLDEIRFFLQGCGLRPFCMLAGCSLGAEHGSVTETFNTGWSRQTACMPVCVQCYAALVRLWAAEGITGGVRLMVMKSRAGQGGHDEAER